MLEGNVEGEGGDDEGREGSARFVPRLLLGRFSPSKLLILAQDRDSKSKKRHPVDEC